MRITKTNKIKSKIGARAFAAYLDRLIEGTLTRPAMAPCQAYVTLKLMLVLEYQLGLYMPNDFDTIYNKFMYNSKLN